TEDAVLAAFRRELKVADAVVLSDYGKGFLTEKLARALIAETRAAGKPVVVDPRPQHGPRYKGSDYVTPNWKESLGLLGWTDRPATPENVTAAGDALRAGLGSSVLLTLGPAGIALFERDGAGHFH